ncbi:MAG: DUF7249 family protein [Steroidobacteraceae bacterium]
MTDQTYNGWKNYETWNVALWIDNEQGSHEYWQERTREILADADCEKDDAASALADALEEWCDEMRDHGSTTEGMFGDLLTHALGQVYWREIAENWLSDVDVYSAGWNMPGCMPDNPPSMFLDVQEARQYIADEMEREADNIAEELETGGESERTHEAERLREQSAALYKTKEGEYGETIGNYHYFVTQL